MKYITIMFKSRNDTLKFYNIMKSKGVFCSIINTPRSLSKSCGISVKTNPAGLNIAVQLLRTNNFATFNGIYEIIITPNGDATNRIY